jgi:hypothetical protein
MMHMLWNDEESASGYVRIQPIRWVIIDKASYDSYDIQSGFRVNIKIAVGRVFVGS